MFLKQRSSGRRKRYYVRLLTFACSPTQTPTATFFVLYGSRSSSSLLPPCLFLSSDVLPPIPRAVLPSLSSQHLVRSEIRAGMKERRNSPLCVRPQKGRTQSFSQSGWEGRPQFNSRGTRRKRRRRWTIVSFSFLAFCVGCRCGRIYTAGCPAGL